MVERLRLQAPSAGGLGSTPGQETRSRMLQLRVCMPQWRSRILSPTAKTQHSQRKIIINKLPKWIIIINILKMKQVVRKGPPQEANTRAKIRGERRRKLCVYVKDLLCRQREQLVQRPWGRIQLTSFAALSWTMNFLSHPYSLLTLLSLVPAWVEGSPGQSDRSWVRIHTVRQPDSLSTGLCGCPLSG